MAAARDRRASRTTGLSPFLARKALTSTKAACGLSGCTGRAAYYGDTNVTEQPEPNRAERQGMRHSAAAGVASSIKMATLVIRCSIAPPWPDSEWHQATWSQRHAG